MMTERSLESNQELYIRFAHYNKAFDIVGWKLAGKYLEKDGCRLEG